MESLPAQDITMLETFFYINLFFMLVVRLKLSSRLTKVSFI